MMSLIDPLLLIEVLAGERSLLILLALLQTGQYLCYTCKHIIKTVSVEIRSSPMDCFLKSMVCRQRK